jgi:hypothetical protein
MHNPIIVILFGVATVAAAQLHLFLEVGFLAKEPPAVAVAGDEVGPVMRQEYAGRLLQLQIQTTTKSSACNRTQQQQ